MGIKFRKKDADNNSAKSDRKSYFNKKYLKNGAYSAGITAVFAAIIVAVNLIIGALPSKYTQIDISAEKLYSIGEETKQMLHDLKTDVVIYQIAQSGKEDENISKLLQRYADESKHVTVEVKDPVVNPKFVTAYTSEKLKTNSLIVVCGERNKVVNYDNMYQGTMDYNTYSYQTTAFDGEGQITGAIAYVVSEDLPILYTLEGHGEQELDSTIKEDIEKANMEIKSLNLITEGEVPEDADCLLIESPATDISEDEKNAVISYLEDGGKAIVFSDYTGQEMPNFDAVLENYGVQRAEGIIFEDDSQHYAMQTPYYLIPTINSTEVTTDVAEAGYYVLMPYAQGIQKMEETRDSLTIESLLTTSDSAYSKVNVNGASIAKETGDIDGPFDLGVSIRESLGDGKETKVIYFSTANILQNEVNQMVSGGNEKLVMSAMNWLTDTEETTSVSIPAKSLQVSYLTLTDYDASFWKICTMGVIPAVFVIVGFLIWLRRRKA